MKSFYTDLHSGGAARKNRIRMEAKRSERLFDGLPRFRLVQGGDEGFNAWMLESLEAEWRDCESCPLADNRGELVFGEGCPYPDLAIVGDVPSAAANASGRPFSDDAGILLRRALKATELARGKTYLLNRVLCRPPRGRKVRENELKACEPRLVQHIASLRPRAILLLGSVAASWCGATSRDRGRLPRDQWPDLEKFGQTRLTAVFLTWHPRYVARRSRAGDRQPAREFLTDLGRVKRHLELAS